MSVRFERVGESTFAVRGYDDVARLLADSRFAHWIARDGGGSPFRRAAARWLDAMDPRRAQASRATVARALGAAATAARAPRMRERANALLNEVRDGVPFDVMSHYAEPLTRELVADVLGVPAAMRTVFEPLAGALLDHVPRALFAASDETDGVLGAWHTLVEAVAASSEPGLATALRADLAAAPERDDDLTAFTAMFAYAASDNIARFVAGAAYGLYDRPPAWNELAHDPRRISRLLEEWLRYESPLQLVHLVANEDVDEGGVHVGAGDSVFACVGAANRDGARFAAADTFDPQREPARHLAFGAGPLACIGAVAARAHAVTAVEGLLARFEPAGVPEGFPFVRLRARAQRGRRADAMTYAGRSAAASARATAAHEASSASAPA